MMKAEQIQKATEQIRQLVIEHDIEAAISQLNQLTKQIGGDYWDEALTISSNQNKLDTQIRSGFVTENEAEVAQNKLIDRILELARNLEKDGSKITITEETARKTVTVTVENTKSKSNNSKWLWALALLVPLCIWLAFKAFSKEAPTQELPKKEHSEKTIPTIKETTTPKNEVVQPKREERPTRQEDECTKLMEQGKQAYNNQNVDLATAYFKKASKVCESDYEPLNWLDMTYRMEAKIKKEQQQSEQTAPSNTATQNNERFTKLAREGKALFEEKEYEKSYATFQTALTIKNNETAKDYIRKLKELLYNKYRILGMNAYNAKRYEEALPHFKRAQTYKDISQIRMLIKKCEPEF